MGTKRAKTQDPKDAPSVPVAPGNLPAAGSSTPVGTENLPREVIVQKHTPPAVTTIQNLPGPLSVKSAVASFREVASIPGGRTDDGLDLPPQLRVLEYGVSTDQRKKTFVATTLGASGAGKSLWINF